MGIFSRLSDIVNSNLVHMLDKAEDPEKMVRLMIQEMEDTLVEVKSTAARVLADQKNIDRQMERIQNEKSLWERRAVLAIENDRDDLARAALEEKNLRQKEQESLQRDAESLTLRVNEYRQDIGKLEDKLQEAKRRQKAIVARKRTAQSRLEIHHQIRRASSAHAIAKFDQMERSIDRLESELECQRERDSGNLDQEFFRLEQKESLEDELVELKRKIKGKKNASPQNDSAQEEK